jgi:hypothetical protein
LQQESAVTETYYPATDLFKQGQDSAQGTLQEPGEEEVEESDAGPH